MKASKNNSRRLIRKILLSLGIGAFLTVVLYLCSNLDFAISTENPTLKWWYELTSGFRKGNNPIPNDMLFINTSYDRELAPFYDEYGFEIGNIDITNREKLTELLQLLQSSNKHKYIFLDIRFEKSITTDNDSLLFQTIHNTPRIVIPTHQGLESASDLISKKAAMADFVYTIEDGDFTKYINVYSDYPSMAMRAYQDLTGKQYSSFCGFYFSDGHLMKKAMMPKLEISANNEYDSNGYKKVYHLGADILSDSTTSKELFKDKYIFIGDFFENDMHPSYKGDIAGIVIHSNAFNDIRAGRHLIGWFTLLFIWLCISGAVWLVLSEFSISKALHKYKLIPAFLTKSRYWHIIRPLGKIFISLLGYGSLMTIIFIILFLLTNQIYEIIVISLILVIISVIIKSFKK